MIYSIAESIMLEETNFLRRTTAKRLCVLCCRTTVRF
jgi:hypothetical protein